MLVGLGRRVWAQLASNSIRYAKLSSPVRIPLESVATPWHPVPFKAEAATSGSAPRRVVLSGMLFRRITGDDRPPLSALCLTCTHEQCQVDFVEEPGTLPRMDRPLANPVFFCACHSSVFNAVDDGAWVAGPASRGLYRFHLDVIDDKIVEIDAVEEDALLQA